MSQGGEIARVIALYELQRTRAQPAAHELHVRLLEAEGDTATLDLVADEARAIADAYEALATAAMQASIAVDQRREEARTR